MKIYIGSDHAGFELKNVLVSHLELMGHEVTDKGAFNLDPADDYPDFVSLVAEGVVEDLSAQAGNSGAMGIVLGGSGTGEAIEANRLFGVRAAVYYGGNEEIVKLAREHNDANILSLGARFISEDEAKKVVDLFLETKFSGDERHKRRILKLDN
jgi:ribose 5-phosphate isomerase B